MKVLLVTQNFYPENFKSNEIAFELVKRGYEVDALVSIPNYPEGHYYKGYGIFSKRKEVVNGVNIYRSFQFARGKGAIGLILNYLSFLISSCFNVLFFFSFKKYDCIIVHQTSPILQALPAVLLKKIKKIPLYMWVLDIWPDSMISGGGIHNKSIVRTINNIVTYIYKKCDKILISSKMFRELVNRNGDFDDKIEYFPNWAEDILNMPKLEVPKLPDGFKIMMAGNLGGAQCLEDVMKTALSLKDLPNVKWIFVGDGSKKEWLESFVKEHNLEETVFLVGRHPFSEMPSYFSQADAMLVTLKADFPHLRAVVPARVQSYMSAGRPILAMASGGVSQLLEEADCGYCVHGGNSDQLAKIIRETVLTNIQDFTRKGENGRIFFENHFTIKLCIDNLEKIINKN